MAVDYGHGWGEGLVEVLLNGQVLDSLTTPTYERIISVDFEEGDILRIQEGSDGTPGVLVLNAIEFDIKAPFDPASGSSNGTIIAYQKICDVEGVETALNLDDNDSFGFSATSIGDLNGDNINDLVVGAHGDDDGGTDRGAVYVLFLRDDGTVETHQKISDTEGNFAGVLVDGDGFGSSVTSSGDLDGDDVNDLIVGTPNANDGGTSQGSNRGAVWVLFLQSDGTVREFQKISNTEGNFAGVLADHDRFGTSVTSSKDIDGDDINDVVVGALGDDDGGTDRGAVWVLFLQSDGTVREFQKISDTEGGFDGVLADSDTFGRSATVINDLDGDSVHDLVVGSFDDDGGTDRGAVWVLFLLIDGTVKMFQKISNLDGNFAGVLSDHARFGVSISSIGDLDGDGTTDLVVGAVENAPSGEATCRFTIDNCVTTVWADGEVVPARSDCSWGSVVTITFPDSTKNLAVKGSDSESGCNNGGFSIVCTSTVSGSPWEMNSEDDREEWLVFSSTTADEPPSDSNSHEWYEVGYDTEGNSFGVPLAGLTQHAPNVIDGINDMCGTEMNDRYFNFVFNAAPTQQASTPDPDRGAVWVIFLEDTGMIKAHQKISDVAGNFAGGLADDDNFGVSVTSLGDIDGNAINDLAVGAPGSDVDGGTDRGAVWILFFQGNPTLSPTLSPTRNPTLSTLAPTALVGTRNPTTGPTIAPTGLTGISF
jgi:hypothetical protein